MATRTLLLLIIIINDVVTQGHLRTASVLVAIDGKNANRVGRMIIKIAEYGGGCSPSELN